MDEKIKNCGDTFFKIVPGPIYGLCSVILTCIFVFFSIIHYPGYNMLYYDISILGIGPGLSAPLFNHGLKIIGLIAIPFFIYLGKILKRPSNNRKIINKAVILSILGCISLILIGFFPVINFTMGIIHACFALVFFLCSIVNLIIFSYAIYKDQRFSKLHAYFGVCIAGLISFYIAVRWSIVEWMVFFALGFWITDISIYLLYKKILV